MPSLADLMTMQRFNGMFNPAPSAGYQQSSQLDQLMAAMQPIAMQDRAPGLQVMPTTVPRNGSTLADNWNSPPPVPLPATGIGGPAGAVPPPSPAPAAAPPMNIMPQTQGSPQASPGGFRNWLAGPKGDALMGLLSGWAQGSTISDSLGKGGLGAVAGAKQAKRNRTIDAFIKRQGLDPAIGEMLQADPELAQAYIKSLFSNADGSTAEIKNWKFAQDHPDFEKMLGNQGGSLFGTPMPFRKADGSIGYALPSRNGGVVELGAPEGAQFMGPFDKAADTAAGKDEGEAIALYRSINSKMPGLETVVGQLGDLAKKATYTTTGQLIDWTRKELNAQPRDAAVARTQYISIVDNQILPMLRDTFGSQFTAREGDTLRSTLGDPDKTPAEKQAVLESFIAQKRRDLEALQSRIGANPTAPATGAADPLGIR